MSLEQALKENTAAIVALTAVFSTGVPTAIAGVAPAVKDTAGDSGEAPAKAPTKPAGKPAPKAPDTPPADKPLDYDTVAKVMNAFVMAKGKPAALAVLAPFGIDNTPGKRPIEVLRGNIPEMAKVKAAFEAATATTPDVK